MSGYAFQVEIGSSINRRRICIRVKKIWRPLQHTFSFRISLGTFNRALKRYEPPAHH